MPSRADFSPVFDRLKGILQEYEPHLIVAGEGKEGYQLNAPFLYKNNPLFFGAVQIKKNYVSYYLMPVYMFPDLLEGMSPRLKKRMQGKSCFNFTQVDEEALDELAVLTRRAFERSREGLKQSPKRGVSVSLIGIPVQIPHYPRCGGVRL